jgi:hypothetical protein
LTANATYTLSFWYLQSTNGGPLTLRLSGSGIVATVNPAIRPARRQPGPGHARRVEQRGGVADAVPVAVDQRTAGRQFERHHQPRRPARALAGTFNPGTNAISLNGLYLANNYTNLLQWPFPTNASINAGQFKVILPTASPTFPPRTNCTRLCPAQPHRFAGADPARHQRPAAGARLCGLPKHQLERFLRLVPRRPEFLRQEFFQATPGAANNGTATPPPRSSPTRHAGFRLHAKL